MPDRGHRDPDLAGGERLVDLVELLDHGLGAGFAFVGELLDLAAAAADERELGRDEEAVDRDQQQQEDEQQDAHRLCGPVLRAGTSSAIRRTEYSWPSPRHFAIDAILSGQCASRRSARCSKRSSGWARRPAWKSTPTSCAASSRAGWRRCAPRVAGAASPRVIALERLDPPRVAGFWIPEMISIAGGEDVAGDPGLNPPEVGWGELESLSADVVIVMPDGSRRGRPAQAMEHWERIAALGAEPRLRGRRRRRLLRARPAPGRRRRAARPPAPPRPDRPARQHRLRGAAGAGAAARVSG